MTRDHLDHAVRLYKEGLDRSNPEPFLEFVRGLSPGERGSLSSPLREFLKSERARLVKLKSLGLSQDYEPRIAMTEKLVSVLEAEKT
jgi:hypothetical protein